MTGLRIVPRPTLPPSSGALWRRPINISSTTRLRGVLHLVSLWPGRHDKLRLRISPGQTLAGAWFMPPVLSAPDAADLKFPQSYERSVRHPVSGDRRHRAEM